jgi:CelD/BcsL family acetyltransferase involved in cellulose biosynthesis
MTGRLVLRRLDWPVPATARAGWEQIRRAAPTETLFLTLDWLEAWWRHLGPRGRPSILAVEDEAAPVALAPLHRAPIGRSGLVALRPLGVGVSDYLDLLLPPEAERRGACLGALLDGLLARPLLWDVLDLPNVPAESPTVGELSRLGEVRGLRLAVLPGYARPAVALSGTWDDYATSRPSKMRYNLRSRLRRLGQCGPVRFRTADTAGEVRMALGELTRLHARRWAGQRTSTIFSSSLRARAFYAEVVQRYAASGLLDLTLLEVGDRVVAGSLGFVERGTFYYYLPAWEPELAIYAPSSLLLAHLIERAFAAGLERFDFMLGDEPYKAQWATEERHTVRLVIANRGVRGRAAFEALISWHGLRQRARASELLQHARRYGLARAVGRQLSAISRRRSAVGDRGSSRTPDARS